MWDKVWTFKTARFEIGLEFGPDEHADLSWDDDGEVTRQLERGHLFLFTARTYVKFDGVTVGEDYLGGCIYKDEREFMRDGYFRDMVRVAVSEARRELARRQASPVRLRAA